MECRMGVEIEWVMTMSNGSGEVIIDGREN